MDSGIYELLYEIVSDVSRGAAQLITGIALAVLCGHFMADRQAKRYGWLVGAAYFAVAVFCLYVPVNMYAFVAYLLSFLAAYLVLYRLEKENARVWFFLCFTFFTIRWLASSVSYRVSCLVEMRLEERILLSSGIAQENMRPALFCSFFAFRLIETALFVLILFGVCRGIRSLFFFNRSGMEKKELLLLMIPSVSGVICYVWSGRSFNAVWEETNLYIDDMDPAYRVMEFVMQVLLLAAIMAMLYLYQKLKQEQGKKQSDRLLLQEIRNMRAHIEEVELLHEDLRGMRHDMRNHISVLKRLLERGAFGQARDYLDSMGRACGEAPEADGERKDSLADTGQQAVKENVETQEISSSDMKNSDSGLYLRPKPKNRPAGEIRTGNPVTDVILAEHQRKIAAAGAGFEADFHYPDKAAVDAFDLSIVLDNALTNALEAVVPGGFIHIRSFREHHAYLIVVENSFSGRLAPKGTEGLPMTTKQPVWAHGFGLRHMKAVAEHYHGALTIEQEGELVRLSVMLCV